jgi:hypothetical protein
MFFPGEADVTTRGNAGWRATVATLKDGSIEFEMVWDTGDADFGAALAGDAITLATDAFLIHAADLVLGGSPTLPERGDLIRETQGTKIFIYEVMAPGKEPPWRWSDVYRKLLRIHTKQVGTEGT